MRSKVKGILDQRFKPPHRPEPKVFFVNINRHVVAANRRHQENEPPVRFTRGRYGAPVYAYEVRLAGPVLMKYDPKNPLPCGASAWIECGGVEVVR